MMRRTYTVYKYGVPNLSPECKSKSIKVNSIPAAISIILDENS